MLAGPEESDVNESSMSVLSVELLLALRVELALVGPDDRDLPGDVEIMSETEARLVFEPLATEGEYLVRFLAEEEGHLIGGAISFVYGDQGGGDVLVWVLFGLAAAVILAVGAFFSLRRDTTGTDDTALVDSVD